MTLFQISFLDVLQITNMKQIWQGGIMQRVYMLLYAVFLSSCVWVINIKLIQDKEPIMRLKAVTCPRKGTEKKVLDRFEYDYRDIYYVTSHNITEMEQIEFIPNLRDACFYVRYNDKKLLRCLPKTYLVGFNKCGTTDLSTSISSQFVKTAYLKEPLFWSDTRDGQNFTFGMYLEAFNYGSSIINHCCINTNATNFDIQEALIEPGDIELQEHEFKWYNHSYHRAKVKPNAMKRCDKIRAEVLESGVCEVSLLDASPASAWYQHRLYEAPYGSGVWEEDLISTAAKLQQVIPDAKLIFMMRDPVARLWSDYNFYYPYIEKNEVSAEHFHKVVVKSIAWWKKCLTLAPLDSCLYDLNFTDNAIPNITLYLEEDIMTCLKLAPLDSCLYDLNFTESAIPNITLYWEEDIMTSGVARLRIGLYVLHIKVWLEHFGIDQCLFLRLEDYAAEKEKVINQQVYPFLGYESSDEPPRNRRNKANYAIEKMFDKTKKLLTKFYRPYNRALSYLLNDAAFKWR